MENVVTFGHMGLMFWIFPLLYVLIIGFALEIAWRVMRAPAPIADAPSNRTGL